MIGKIFITSSGYDPQLGKHVKDPYLGPNASLGACRPDFRRQVKEGDHLFVISGKLPNVRQFVMGGFEVAEKIDAHQAYQIFPDQRLQLRDDGQLTGNIIVNADGARSIALTITTRRPSPSVFPATSWAATALLWSNPMRSRLAASKRSMPCAKSLRRTVDRLGRSWVIMVRS